MALFAGVIDNGMMNYGNYTILKEVLDNSVDEFTTGFGKNIIVDVDEKPAIYIYWRPRYSVSRRRIHLELVRGGT